MEPAANTVKTPRVERKPHHRSGFSFFWLIPIAAVGLTVVLFYQTMKAQGELIHITFANARGLVAEKSEVRFQGLKVGVVKHIKLSPDLKSVEVEVQLERSADDLAKEGTQFWIVYPEIGIGGISGLDTIIGGNYIRVQAGHGEPTTEFTGLDTPPTNDPNSPDIFVRLVATKMPSVGMDSPIIYRQLQVGEVEDMHYEIDQHKAIVDIRIYQKYSGLVRKDTHFWNTSGLDVSVGLSGLDVKSPSLSSMIFGSITMGIPDGLLTTSPLVGDGGEFQLYDSVQEVVAKEAERINKDVPGLGTVLSLKLKDSQGITVDHTELRYRGIKIGTVVSVQLTPDFSGVIAKVLLMPTAMSLARANAHVVLVWPQIKVKDLTRLQIAPDAVSGPYFRLEAGDGDPCTDFTVADIDNDAYHPIEGLVLALRAPEMGTLTDGSPIYYRGVQVGQVERSVLASDSTAVQVRAVILSQYAPLVRSNTRFWNSSGIVSHVSIWGGVNVSTPPISEAINAGSISFATPDNALMGNKVSSGAVFTLADKADDTWLKWQPTIPLNP